MKKNIIILGAGFGGVRAAIKINRGLKKNRLWEKYRLMLINAHSYHTYTPLLYEIATTSEKTATFLELKSIVTHPLERIFRGRNVEIIEDTVLKIDPKAKTIRLREGKIDFDCLVIALGGETNFYDIPGLADRAYALKSFNEAIALRNALTQLVENCPNEIPNRVFKIVICGGGSTGVELAGEIKGWLPELDQDCRKTCGFDVSLVQGAGTILPQFSEPIVKKAVGRLTRLGIKIFTKAPVRSVDKERIFLANGKTLAYDILIWTGGIRAAGAASAWSVKKEKNGKIEVSAHLNCLPLETTADLTNQNIYAIGDVSCLYEASTGAPLPAVARIAIEEADVAAYNIIEKIKKDEGQSSSFRPLAYRPRRYPYIIPLGGKYAIASIGPFVISGFIGWILKGFVELKYLVSILPFEEALTTWFRGLRVFIKNDRLG